MKNRVYNRKATHMIAIEQNTRQQITTPGPRISGSTKFAFGQLSMTFNGGRRVARLSMIDVASQASALNPVVIVSIINSRQQYLQENVMLRFQKSMEGGSPSDMDQIWQAKTGALASRNHQRLTDFAKEPQLLGYDCHNIAHTAQVLREKGMVILIVTCICSSFD
jgi:hypothetical protein